MIQYVFNTLGLTDFKARVGTRDPESDKYVGDDEGWEQATAAIIQAAQEMNLPHTVEAGEAAFYGPKLDFVFRDALKREWQLGTVQVDYNLPERFELEYIASDDSRQRPVMIHRAPFGSMDRFIGIIIEHFGGDFPVWLSPVQAVLIPIADRHEEPAQEIVSKLTAAGLRAQVDDSRNRMGNKIRVAREQHIPYMLILGDRDLENSTVSVRLRNDEDLGAMSLEDFIALAKGVIESKSMELQ